MTSAYVLILAILILGGIIAALGDRIGTKVGKARLRLFNLRPRQTATLVTILTGTAIAASTLGVLFSLSKSLRDGVFELDKILQKRRQTEAELIQVTQQKQQVEAELKAVKQQEAQISSKLKQTNQDLQKVHSQLTNLLAEAKTLKEEVASLSQARQTLLQQQRKLQRQSQQLQQRLQERDKELRARAERIRTQEQILRQQKNLLQELEAKQRQLAQQIAQRDQQISQLDEKIALKDRNLKLKEEQLNQLEGQISFLQQEVAVLEQYYSNYQNLRERKIAIFKGQVLALAAIRIVEPTSVVEAIDLLLSEANRQAIKSLDNPRLDPEKDRVVRITKAQVENLIKQIKDGKEYVVRILSASNYVEGESQIRVFADVTPNKLVFRQGESIAQISIDGDKFNAEEIQKRLDTLIAASRFRAKSAGVLGDVQIGDGKFSTLIDFLEKLNNSGQSVNEIRAVAIDDTYTIGPLKLRLEALQFGKVIFSS
ncbi:MAG: DUF3084 domain-containing protein [Cyanobacteria bacterium J083]|nr:MAG: DUF3084 domain-containing protein [Cyanobacteria bacterium J083]